MKAMWQLWQSIWTAEACEQVIDMGLKLPLEEGRIGFDDPQNDEYRKSYIRWAYPQGDWVQVFEEIKNFFDQANRNAFGFDVDFIPSIQFTEYDGTEGGKYDWHTDVNWFDTRPTHRKLSMVIQLSDPSAYEGGNLEIQPLMGSGPENESLRERGSVIVFPSFLQHRVTQVTSGKRFSLVVWNEGPKFR